MSTPPYSAYTVALARRRVALDDTVAQVARDLEISHETVRRWVRGETRREAPGPIISGDLPGRISDESIASARARVEAGESHREVADDLGVTIQAVHAWALGVNRAEAGGPIRGHHMENHGDEGAG